MIRKSYVGVGYSQAELDAWADMSATCGGCGLALARCACASVCNVVEIPEYIVSRAVSGHLEGTKYGHISRNWKCLDHIYYTWRKR